MSSDKHSEVYELRVDTVEEFILDFVGNLKIQRVTHSDIDEWSEGDWLLVAGNDILTHFPDKDYINEEYIQNWFYGFLKGVSK